MGSAVASLLLVTFPSPPRLRRGAGAAGGVVACHRVGPPRRFAPPAPASRAASRLAFAGGKCAQAHFPNSLLTLVQGGDCRLMNRSHVYISSAPRPSLRACRAPSSRSLHRRP